MPDAVLVGAGRGQHQVIDGVVPGRLRPARHVSVVGAGGQYLLGDGATHRVAHPAAQAVLRFLADAGSAATDEVVARVLGEVADAARDDVEQALRALVACGAVVRDLGDVPGRVVVPDQVVGLADAMRAHRGRPPQARTARGAAAGTRPADSPRPRDADASDRAARPERHRSVRVRVVGVDPTSPVVAVLTGQLRAQFDDNGFTVDGEAPPGDGDSAPDRGVVVVACRELSDPAAWEHVVDAGTRGEAAVLVAVGAARVLLSPVLASTRPPRDGGPRDRSGRDDDPCALCLRVHLTRALSPDAARLRHSPTPPVLSPALVAPVTGAVGAALAVTLVVGWLTTGESAIPRREVLEWDAATPRLLRHPVTRRPQCAGCGDPGLVGRRMSAPQHLHSRRVDLDAGYRPQDTAAFLARVRPLLDPVTGVVDRLETTARCGPFHTARVTHAVLPEGAGWRRATALGKGLSADAALAGALGEAVERCSTAWHGDEPAIRVRAADLGDDAVLPGDVDLFSESQRRGAAPVADHDTLPEPIPAGQPLDWTPVFSPTTGRRRWIPTAALVFGHPQSRWAHPDSNGCAAGGTWEDAVLQGALELVERDAVGIWWYGRCPRPEVVPTALGNESAALLARVARHLDAQDRDVWLLDLTTDLGVPVIAAVSARRRPGPDGGQAITFGFGAHVDLDLAVVRALGELAQVLAVGPEAARESDRIAQPQAEAFWAAEALDAHPYLSPADGAPAARVRVHPTRDLATDLASLDGLLAGAGLELLAADLTRPDLSVPVARVIVPGLRQFTPRLAPGRLYDVPVRLGWVSHPLRESDVNPVALFV